MCAHRLPKTHAVQGRYVCSTDHQSVHTCWRGRGDHHQLPVRHGGNSLHACAASESGQEHYTANSVATKLDMNELVPLLENVLAPLDSPPPPPPPPLSCKKVSYPLLKYLSNGHYGPTRHPWAFLYKRSEGRHHRHSAVNDILHRALRSAQVRAIRSHPLRRQAARWSDLGPLEKRKAFSLGCHLPRHLSIFLPGQCHRWCWRSSCHGRTKEAY